MKRVLIIGASGGIGGALAEACAEWKVARLSRRDDGFDVSDAANVDQHLDALAGPFDEIIVATGILGTPEKSLGAITAVEMQRLFAVNTIGPALILRHVPRLLAPQGKVAVLSARVGSIGDNQIGGWHSYRASKAALNQIVHGAAIELARSHKGSVCVALHPGTVQTPFTARYAGRHKTVPAKDAAKNLLQVINDLTPDQTGGFYDYAGNPVAW
uniref:SDR family NAD(P)-dependent oxidoreductase n=1 Tax=Yoonia sp. TaxID=2212373 RepID=UPI0040482B01|tara:strand:- start:1395 stop:2036 length:642 start_codon:yes stop_codon:yes gene_type:complete